MNRKKEIIALNEKVSKLIDKNYELKIKVDSILHVLEKSDILKTNTGNSVFNGQYMAKWDLGGIKAINDKRGEILFKLMEALGYKHIEEQTPYVPAVPSEYVLKVVKINIKGEV